MPRPAAPRRLSPLPFVAGLCLASVGVLAPARADEPAPPAPASERLDLSPFLAPPAAAGAVLRALSDGEWEWRSTTLPSEDEEGQRLLSFAPPPFPDRLVPPDVLDDALRRLLPESGTSGLVTKMGARSLEVFADPPVVEKTRVALAQLRAALAPRLPLAVELVRKDAATGPRTEALARVELAPRRWTRVLWRRDVRRLVVAVSAELSTGALVHVPEVASLASGAELHVRWTPGEGTSLLEVAVCAIDEGTSVPVDLSGMRNVPEASTMGTLSLPRMPVARVLLAVPVPAKGPGVAEIAFDDGERSRVLRLSTVGDGPSADAEVRTGSFGAVRVGASASGLDFGVRGVGTEEAIARFQAGGGTSAREVRSIDAFGEAFLLVEGPAVEVARLRRETVRAEASIQALPVDLRTVPVLDAVLRERLADGSVALGAPVSAAVLQALRDPRRGSGAALHLPAAGGLPSQVRIGAAVAGLSSFHAGVAQDAAGIFPTTEAYFDGLAGEVVARPSEDGGALLRFRGRLSWARSDGAKAELAYRAPLSFRFQDTGTPKVEDPTVRRLTLPLATLGESAVDASASISAAGRKDGALVLLAVVSSGPADGGGPVLVLGSVR